MFCKASRAVAVLRSAATTSPLVVAATFAMAAFVMAVVAVGNDVVNEVGNSELLPTLIVATA